VSDHERVPHSFCSVGPSCDFVMLSRLVTRILLIWHCASNYSGNYTEKAEISLITPSATRLEASLPTQPEADVYRSCLSFEVKVMEVSNPGAVQTGGEGLMLDRCVLCTGVLHHAHKVAQLDGRPPQQPLYHQASREFNEDVLAPSELTSGMYEVLLYTLYNPDSEIDITLVGKVTVSLYVPELVLPATVPQLVTHPVEDRASGIARFQAHSDPRVAMAEWLAHFKRCCESLVPTAGSPGIGDARTSVITELRRLLQVLVSPALAETSMHTQIVSYLQHSGRFDVAGCVVPALQEYFEDWLTSDALSALMNCDDANNGDTTRTGAGSAPSSPSRPSSRPSSPTWGSGSNAGSPAKYGTGAASPGNKSSARKALRSGAAGVYVRPAYGNIQDAPWDELEAAASCLRLLRGLAYTGRDSRGGAPATAEKTSSDEGSLTEGHTADGSLDATALAEVAADLANAVFRQLSRVLQVWSTWYAAVKDQVKTCKGQVKLGQDAVERLQRGVTAACILLACVPALSADAQGGLLALCSDVRSFVAEIASAAMIEDTLDAGAEEEWRTWTGEHLTATLGRLLRLVLRYTYPDHDSAGALPQCVECVTTSLCALHDAALLPSSRWGLLVTLTEGTSLLCARLSQRLASYAVNDDTDDLAAALGYSLTLWGKAEPEQEAPKVKIAEPPTSAARKATRRASALTMFGLDATVDFNAAASSPTPTRNPSETLWDRAELSPTFKAGDIAGAGLFDREEAHRSMLTTAGAQAGDAVLYYLQENSAYVQCVQAVVLCLQALQPGPATAAQKGASLAPAKGKAMPTSTAQQDTVGVLTALQSIMDTVEDIGNALLRGRVLNPTLLKVWF
jgi:hypothetical protein